MDSGAKKAVSTLASAAVRQSGFSLVELLMVGTLVLILTAVSVPYLYNYQRMYRSEEEALKLLDLMKEANQRALITRRTFRFEIDMTQSRALIIDEAGTDPDVLVKSIPLRTNEVRFDAAPGGITRPNPPNYADAAFANDTLGHRRGAQTVIGNRVWAARFRSDGTVLNAANNPISATLYVWPPTAPGATTTRRPTEVRSITMFGGSGAVRYWKYDGSTFKAF
jgi:type II secretory pathway pseudopilin PulG